MDERLKQKTIKSDLPHNIIMENRTKISVSGVENAESYNENEVVLNTSKGILIIKGECLGLSKLNLDSGEITVNGALSPTVAPPININGSNLVSARVIAEAVDAQVVWNDNTRTVEITN